MYMRVSVMGFDVASVSFDFSIRCRNWYLSFLILFLHPEWTLIFKMATISSVTIQIRKHKYGNISTQ